MESHRLSPWHWRSFSLLCYQYTTVSSDACKIERKRKREPARSLSSFSVVCDGCIAILQRRKRGAAAPTIFLRCSALKDRVLALAQINRPAERSAVAPDLRAIAAAFERGEGVVRRLLSPAHEVCLAAFLNAGRVLY